MIAIQDPVDSSDTLIDLFKAGEGKRFVFKSFHDIIRALFRNVDRRTPVFALDISKKVFESFGYFESAAVYGIRHTRCGDIFYDGIFLLT
jgi:hypothetical protein